MMSYYSKMLLIAGVLFLSSLFLTWQSTTYSQATTDNRMTLPAVQSAQQWRIATEPTGNIFNLDRNLNQSTEESAIQEQAPPVEMDQNAYRLLAITELGSISKALFLIKDERRLVTIGDLFPPFGEVTSIANNQIVISSENGEEFTWSLFPVPAPKPEDKEEVPAS